MTDLLIISIAMIVTGWATWPPRGEQRRWLLFALAVLWGALVAIGWQRGIQPGFVLWLIVLSAIGALVGLVALWSLTNMLGRARE
jgi:hypothetical protein